MEVLLRVKRDELVDPEASEASERGVELEELNKKEAEGEGPESNRL